MKTYGQRIQEYRDFVQQTCIREEAESRAIKACPAKSVYSMI